MQRYDTVAIKATKTNEGFIRDAPVIGRSGIMRYLNADGSERYEYRPPDEAFKADSLETLMGKPITLGHQGMVTAGNADAIKPIGSVLTAGRKDGDAIRADIMIYSLPTSARELSCGYTLDLDEEPGTTPDGKHYDAIQRNIRYNHVAVVPRGRAGIARLNMDGDQFFVDEKKGKGDPTMAKIRLDNGLEYEAPQEVSVFVEALRKDAADKQQKIDALQAKYDIALGDNKKLKEDMEKADKKHQDSLADAINARVALLAVATDHKIDKADAMTDKDIKIAVIKAARGDSISLDGKSDDYIDAAFDMAKVDQAKHDDGMASQRKDINDPKPDDAGSKNDDIFDDPQAALEKLQQDEADLWMKEVK